MDAVTVAAMAAFAHIEEGIGKSNQQIYLTQRD